MISVFGWPDPNTGFDQSEHALYACYFIINYLVLFGRGFAKLLSTLERTACVTATIRCIKHYYQHTVVYKT